MSNRRQICNSVKCCKTFSKDESLQSRVISTTLSAKYQELQDAAQSPVCLFPTKRACSDFNGGMLSKLPTTLDRLNKDCNLAAGLEVVLCIAVGACVILWRNIDTANGLVSGALGTSANKDSAVEVRFDHMTDVVSVTKVKKENLRVQKAVSSYSRLCHHCSKCQGISLSCAVIDVSDEVFSPGMAYVALSQVRTLESLYLTAFTPSSIMVSTRSLQEVNRLCRLYRPDLTPYTMPNERGIQ